MFHKKKGEKAIGKINFSSFSGGCKRTCPSAQRRHTACRLSLSVAVSTLTVPIRLLYLQRYSSLRIFRIVFRCLNLCSFRVTISFDGCCLLLLTKRLLPLPTIYPLFFSRVSIFRFRVGFRANSIRALYTA